MNDTLVARLEKWATELDAYQDTYEQEANMLREAIAALADAPVPPATESAAPAYRQGTEAVLSRAAQESGQLRCLDCGLSYEDFPLDMTLPDEQWRAIHSDDGGVLCAACIVKRAAQLPNRIAVRACIEFAEDLRPCRRCGAIKRAHVYGEFCYHSRDVTFLPVKVALPPATEEETALETCVNPECPVGCPESHAIPFDAAPAPQRETPRRWERFGPLITRFMHDHWALLGIEAQRFAKPHEMPSVAEVLTDLCVDAVALAAPVPALREQEIREKAETWLRENYGGQARYGKSRMMTTDRLVKFVQSFTPEGT